MGKFLNHPVLRLGALGLVVNVLWRMSIGMTVGSLWYVLGLTTLLMLFVLVEVYWSYQTKQWVKLVEKNREEIEDLARETIDSYKELTDSYKELTREYVAFTMTVAGDSATATSIRSEPDPRVIKERLAELEARLESVTRHNGKPPKGRPPNTTYCTEKEFRDAVRAVYDQCVEDGQRPTWALVAMDLGVSERTLKRYKKEWGFDWPSRE